MCLQRILGASYWRLCIARCADRCCTAGSSLQSFDLFFSISIAKGVSLRSPLTADLIQLATAYILTQLRQVHPALTELIYHIASALCLQRLSMQRQSPQQPTVSPLQHWALMCKCMTSVHSQLP
jgi:hypothetical protein